MCYTQACLQKPWRSNSSMCCNIQCEMCFLNLWVIFWSGCFKSHSLTDTAAGLNSTSQDENAAAHWHIKYMQSICSAKSSSIICIHPWYVDLCHYKPLWLKLLHSWQRYTRTYAICYLTVKAVLSAPHFIRFWHDNQNSAINLLRHPTARWTAGLRLNFRGGKWI